MDKLKTLLLSALAVFLLAACATDTPEEDTQTDDATDTVEEIVEDAEEAEQLDKLFTLDELSEYDGRDGNLAYVAVDGIVYDVTGVDAWAGGMHKEGLTAGNDHTEAILGSPHGKSVLAELTKVGTITEE